jgi:hypothetical protein
MAVVIIVLCPHCHLHVAIFPVMSVLVAPFPRHLLVILSSCCAPRHCLVAWGHGPANGSVSDIDGGGWCLPNLPDEGGIGDGTIVQVFHGLWWWLRNDQNGN